MISIRDRDGHVIHESRTLRGIRRYVSAHVIKVLDVSCIGYSLGGQLSILFVDCSSFQTNFASFSMLCAFVRRWRNVYGAPLRVNGNDRGLVSRTNPNEE